MKALTTFKISGCLYLLLLITGIIIIFTGGCADTKTMNVPVIEKSSDGKTSVADKILNVKPYGLFTLDDKIDGIHYSVCTGNVILSIIFSETVIVPVYLVGWKLWEADGLEKEKPVIYRE